MGMLNKGFKPEILGTIQRRSTCGKEISRVVFFSHERCCSGRTKANYTSSMIVATDEGLLYNEQWNISTSPYCRSHCWYDKMCYKKFIQNIASDANPFDNHTKSLLPLFRMQDWLWASDDYLIQISMIMYLDFITYALISRFQWTSVI